MSTPGEVVPLRRAPSVCEDEDPLNKLLRIDSAERAEFVLSRLETTVALGLAVLAKNGYTDDALVRGVRQVLGAAFALINS